MADPLRILFLSAEVAPFAKTGGLGDIGGSLPKALHDMGHDVRVVMPAYRKIEEGYPGVSSMPLQLNVPTGSGVINAGAFEGRLPGSDVPVYFIAEYGLFARPNIYGYWDDPYRFAFFSKAALHLTLQLDWRPDVVHAHDWHTAPALAWLHTAGQSDERFRGIGSVFTIHNLAHQGKTNWNVFDYMQLFSHSLAEEGLSLIHISQQGVTWWRNSASHFSNMLNPRWTEAGVGFAVGNGQNFYVMVFGTQSEGPPPRAEQQVVDVPFIVAPIALAAPNPDGSIVHVVGEGHTFWAIAARYEVSIADLYLFNGMNDDTMLNPGDKLTIRLADGQPPPPTPTPPTTHTVREGESLWTIAAAYRTDLDTLLWLNGVTIDHVVYAGDQVKVRLGEGCLLYTS